MTVKAVIFDLDGTLAATLDLPLSSGGLKRVPFDVLRLSPAGKPPAAVTITDQHRHLPGELIARGYRTAIITRSPSAYASTLTGILQLDTERLLASSTGSTPATKLGKLSAEWDVPIGEMLYVGDTDQDREEAVTAGAQFRRASADMPAEVLDDLPGPGSDDASTETTSPIIPGGSHIDWRCGNCKLALAMIREQLPTVCPGCQSQLLSPQQAPPAMREVIDTVLGETPLTATEVEAIEGSSDKAKAAAAGFVALLQHPARHRSRLQAFVLRHLPQEARDCVVAFDLEEGRFGFDPRLVTLNEITSQLSAEAAGAAARIFPPVRHSTEPVPATGGSYLLQSMWPFGKDPYGGAIWAKLKNWHGGPNGKSGPEVHQSLLHFIALTLAGHLPYGAKESGVAIVPAPSSDLSPAQPGQCSLRLAYRIGDLSGCEVLPALKKEGQKIICDADLSERSVVLVDDQTTKTSPDATASRCVTALLGEGATVQRVLTWSSSWNTTEPTTPGCWLKRHGHECPRHHADDLAPF